MSSITSRQAPRRRRRTLRIGLSALTGIAAGIAASPLAGIAVTWTFLGVLLIGWVLVTVRNRRLGLRHNDHAPMTPDAEMPARSALDAWGPSVVAVLVYAFLTFGRVIEDDVLGWIWAGTVAVTVSWALIWWTLTTDHTRTLSVFDGNGDRTLTQLLFALHAVPSGNQVTRDRLIREASEVGMDPGEVADAVATLAAQDRLVVVTERERSGERVDWISLTGTGAAEVGDTTHAAS